MIIYLNDGDETTLIETFESGSPLMMWPPGNNKMLLNPTNINGAFVLGPEISEDQRGTLYRTFSSTEFAQLGLVTDLAQCLVSHNPKKGTLRGLHYQLEPFQEIKMVRCTRGAIYDVIIDLRKESPSFKQWFGKELNEQNLDMLYIPAGCAHGFISLLDNSDVCYQISGSYNPEYARSIAWNDPAFSVAWPIQPLLMSQKDRDCPPYREKEHS